MKGKEASEVLVSLAKFLEQQIDVYRDKKKTKWEKDAFYWANVHRVQTMFAHIRRIYFDEPTAPVDQLSVSGIRWSLREPDAPDEDYGLNYLMSEFKLVWQSAMFLSSPEMADQNVLTWHWTHAEHPETPCAE